MGDTLDDLIIQFRSHEEDPALSKRAALTLIERFQNLTRKYVTLLTTGSFKPKDELVVFFLTLCSSSLGTTNPMATSLCLKTNLRRYSREELVHICDVAILTTAAKKSNIARNYHFHLWELIEPLLDDTVPLNTEVFQLRVHDTVEINEDWVMGRTCSEIFADLTIEEREIVKLLWYNQIPENKVRGTLNLTAEALLQKKQSIYKKLGKYKKGSTND